MKIKVRQALPVKQENIIIVTQVGFDKLQNQNQWCDRNFVVNKQASLSKMVDPAQPKKQIFHIRDRMSQFSSPLKRKDPQSYSKKVIKKHMEWNQTQTKFSQMMQREADKQNIDKLIKFQWPEVTGEYKKNIKVILKNWETNHKSIQNRKKQRLRSLFQHKYASSTIQLRKKQKFLQKPFFYPRLNQMNYAEEIFQPKQRSTSNKQKKFYLKILNQSQV